MSTTERGRQAEAAVAAWLAGRGWTILARNWRTRWHEVDIVARNETGVHFVEVKYRANPAYGTGFDYITHDKLARLRRAALNWVQVNRYTGSYQIDAVSVSGSLEKPKIDIEENV